MKFSNPERVPKYIVNPMSLESAMADRNFRLHAWSIESEMSQMLLGLKDDSAAESARKLRLQCTNILAKVRRKSMVMETPIQMALEAALRIDASRPTMYAIAKADIAPIAVEPRDGLPVDELEIAQTAQSYRSAGLMSIEDGVEARVRNPDAAAEEVARIKSENAAATAAMTPDVFMHGEVSPGETQPNGSTSVNPKDQPNHGSDAPATAELAA
jgi:hypothetical protein